MLLQKMLLQKNVITENSLQNKKLLQKRVITKKRGIGKEKMKNKNGCSENPMFYY